MGNKSAGPVTGSGKVPSKRLSSGDVASKVGMAAKTGSLSLSASKLSATPSIIFTLTALRKLDLSHNGLTSLSPTDAASTPSFAALVNLRTLDLSHNKLTELSPALAALTLLVTLDLEANCLTVESFLGVTLPPSLEDLNLSSNRLLTVPAAVTDCRKLVKLNVSSNDISQLPPLLVSLTALQELSAHHCKLSGGCHPLTDFTGLDNLQAVDLSFNGCRATTASLPPSLFSATRIHKLHLAGNPMTQLDVQGLPGIEPFLRRRKERIDKGLAADVGGADRLCGL